MNGFRRKNAYTKQCNNVTILITRERDFYGTIVWDVYYKKPRFPYTFAFGLPAASYSLDDACRVADENVDKIICTCLFEGD